MTGGVVSHHLRSIGSGGFAEYAQSSHTMSFSKGAERCHKNEKKVAGLDGGSLQTSGGEG